MNHKNTLTVLVTVLAALAAVCLLAAPAISSPAAKGAIGAQDDGRQFWMNNLTEKELNSMTLGQLHQMAQQAWQNATPGQCRMLNQNRSGCRGHGCLMPGSGPDAACSKNAAFGCGGNGRMGRASLLLLMDGLTVEELNNMTLSQVRELEQKKMEDLNNMTIKQVKDLVQKKMEERNNMTLSELREEAKQQRQIASLLNFASIPGVNPVCEAMGGRQGCRGGAL